MTAEQDKQWMAMALRLAMRAWGRTSPNPMVGAVVVRDGARIGAGYHRQAGGPHAEIEALGTCNDAAGGTLYVTLEPCSTHGRTPPCTEAVIRSGVSRVVVGCLDANPAHAGRGVSVLRAAGLKVTVGVLEERCRALNAAFFWWIRHRRPFVALKLAMTLDGRIATAGGQSKWITGARARARVQRLRRWADAVMVGGETALLDNPSLTVRHPPDWPRQPRRLIWTSRAPAAFPADLNIRKAGSGTRFVKPESREQWLEVLAQLGRDEVTALLLEGGGELAASALTAGVVNTVLLVVAPMILGGRDSRPAVGGANPETLADALRLRDLTCQRLGADLLLIGQPDDVHRTD